MLSKASVLECRSQLPVLRPLAEVAEAEEMGRCEDNTFSVCRMSLYGGLAGGEPASAKCVWLLGGGVACCKGGREALAVSSDRWRCSVGTLPLGEPPKVLEKLDEDAPQCK